MDLNKSQNVVQFAKSPLNHGNVNFGSFSLSYMVVTIGAIAVGAVVAAILLITIEIRCLHSKILADTVSISSISLSIEYMSHLAKISLLISLSTFNFPSSCCCFTLNCCNCSALRGPSVAKISSTSQITLVVTARWPLRTLCNLSISVLVMIRLN